MPSINDIVQVAEALEKSPVIVLQDRCVAVRHRNSTCRRCVEACIEDAIDVYGNEVHLDAGACMSCGACTAICPTEALVLVKSPDAALAPAAARSLAQNGGTAVIACARIASRREVDPARFAQVPCLGRVDESLVVGLAAQGAERVLLVEGSCETCKYGECAEAVDETVEECMRLIDAQGGNTDIERVTGFPEAMIAESTEGLIGSTRRGFFTDAVDAAKETAVTAAKATIAQELGMADSDKPIGERLRVSEDGTMPRLQMLRHDALINAMDRIGQPVVDELESRRFANVTIDAGKCNACGMCAVFCPTHALRREEGSAGPSNVLKRLEFWTADCIQCGLCADVCWKDALSLSPIVKTSQLFDFEPVILDLR